MPLHPFFQGSTNHEINGGINIPKKEKPVETSEPAPEAVPSPRKDRVKVKVIIGTLATEDGVFSKGDVFEVSRKRAEAFDRTSVRILE